MPVEEAYAGGRLFAVDQSARSAGSSSPRHSGHRTVRPESGRLLRRTDCMERTGSVVAAGRHMGSRLVEPVLDRSGPERLGLASKAKELDLDSTAVVPGSCCWPNDRRSLG